MQTNEEARRVARVGSRLEGGGEGREGIPVETEIDLETADIDTPRAVCAGMADIGDGLARIAEDPAFAMDIDSPAWDWVAKTRVAAIAPIAAALKRRHVSPAK